MQRGARRGGTTLFGRSGRARTGSRRSAAGAPRRRRRCRRPDSPQGIEKVSDRAIRSSTQVSRLLPPPRCIDARVVAAATAGGRRAARCSGLSPAGDSVDAHRAARPAGARRRRPAGSGARSAPAPAPSRRPGPAARLATRSHVADRAAAGRWGKAAPPRALAPRARARRLQAAAPLAAPRVGDDGIARPVLAQAARLERRQARSPDGRRLARKAPNASRVGHHHGARVGNGARPPQQARQRQRRVGRSSSGSKPSSSRRSDAVHRLQPRRSSGTGARRAP